MLPALTCGGKAGASPDDLREEVFHLQAANRRLTLASNAQVWHNQAERKAEIAQLASLLDNNRSARGRIIEI